MRFLCLVCLLLAGLAFGQTAQSAAPPAAAPPAAGAKTEPGASAMPDKTPEIKAGPDDPVITLKGLCADPTQPGDACKTVITRTQFENIADALQPGIPPAMRRQLASRYGWALKMSAAPEKPGLDKTPAFEEKWRPARIQILAQER